MKLSTSTIKKFCIVPLIFLLPPLGGFACTTTAALNTTADVLNAAGDGINAMSDNIREEAPYLEQDLEAAWYNLAGTMGPAPVSADPATASPALAEAQEAREKLISGSSVADLVANATNLVTAEDIERINNGDFGALNGILPFEINVNSVGEDLAAVLNSLDIGQVSAILKSQAGYHLIQLLDENGGNIRIGHLIFQVDPTAEPATNETAGDETSTDTVPTENADPFQQALDRLMEIASGNGN
ncbi:MAG: peptidylprolyl isomerase [bacterium]|nr:peptidylprolyl isomerase [bacterium]